MTEPNLYIVGFQKCASSTLFDVLTKHSKISGTTPKETFFLVDEDFNRFNFNKHVSNDNCSWNTFILHKNKIILESSVCNFYQKTALEYIGNKNDAKVIFILRDPVERFISVYKYLYGKIDGIPANISIDEFYNKVNKGDFERPMLKYVIEHGKYRTYIDSWVKELGENNIHIVGMKNLVNNTQKTLSNVYRFLSISDEGFENIPHINKSKSFTFPILHKKLVNIFRETLFSNKLTISVYNKLFMWPAIKPILNDEIKYKLKNIYEDEYKSYSHLF